MSLMVALAIALVSLRVRGHCGGAMSGSLGSAIGCCSGWIEHWKMVANFHRATIWSLPIDRTEFVGWGVTSAVMRSFAA